ncbi:MAG TPA: aminodeoxychorismate/anthranilate synthase component II [Candidatus Polarisedimenticolia bacterium]|nr:aminodeoxychorismate/anthranilate synthase component II [Candidatus Polarisedimenticolia bacterium]
MILIIDNYDSFTFNLAQYFEELGAAVEVVRNDAVDLEALAARPPAALVLSPGPGRPADAGVTLEVVRRFSGRVPILGVCLGHQAIAEAAGGRIVPAPTLMHGKTSRIRHDGRGVFAGLPNPLVGTRYHSLVVEEAGLPDDLVVTAHSEEGAVMGLRHRRLAVEGVQFHPESILTERGHDLLANFLRGGRAEVAVGRA